MEVVSFVSTLGTGAAVFRTAAEHLCLSRERPDRGIYAGLQIGLIWGIGLPGGGCEPAPHSATQLTCGRPQATGNVLQCAQ